MVRWLAYAANLRSLVVDHADDFAVAYAAVEADLNVTSLCLYSGPLKPLHGSVEYSVQFGRFHLSSRGSEAPTGWLAMGAAALRDKARPDAFLDHYLPHVDEIKVMTLLHHGSDRNFDPELLDTARPKICVVPAERIGKWKHPGPRVALGVGRRGGMLQVVGSDDRSVVADAVRIP